MGLAIRLIRNDRVIWASCMVACKDADAMVTEILEDILHH